MPSETDTSTETDEFAPAAIAPGDDDRPEPDADRGSEDSDTEAAAKDAEQQGNRRSINWAKFFAYLVLPALALLLALAAGYLKWQDSSARSAGIARIESVAAAKDTTIALLSYKPDTVEKDLDAARDRLTGTFKDSYTQLTHDVVIPGAKEKQISAVATVPAVASVTATPGHAVVLLYVDQTTIIGHDAPSDSVSVVRVTLDDVHGRWLVSEFDPI